MEIRAELLDKGTWRGEILNRRKDGTTFWSSANVSTFDHSVYGTVWICAQIDISERKQAQETLWESEKNLKYVVENSMDASYRRNMRLNRYDFMSPTIEKIIGYTRDELMAMSIDELFANIHPDDHSRIAETLEKAMANEPAPYRVDYRCRTKNGDYRWLSDLFTIIRDDAGLPLYRVGSVRDVTEQKKTEQDLQLFRAIIETSHEAIAACDPSGRLIYINPAHERLSAAHGKKQWHTIIGTTIPPNPSSCLTGWWFPPCKEMKAGKGKCWSTRQTAHTFPCGSVRISFVMSMEGWFSGSPSCMM